MLRRTLVLLVFLGFAALMWPAWSIVAHADDPDDHKTAGQVQSEQGHKIASELMCQCGCGLTVAACRDSMTCTVAAGLVEQIERQVAAGKSESEIKDYFVTVYGEQILALPRKSRQQLLNDLEFVCDELYVIGDAVKPRSMHNAIREGYLIGIRI